MLSNCTAVLRSVTTTRDQYGDETTVSTDTPLEWALIAPRTSTEREDPRAPAVVTAATLYGPFGSDLNADDRVVISGHSATFDGEWLIEGLPGQWSLGGWAPGFEVALVRAS